MSKVKKGRRRGQSADTPSKRRVGQGRTGASVGQTLILAGNSLVWGYAGIILVVAVAITYLPVWHSGFIWDDDQHLTENPCIVGPLGFAQIWTSGQALYYPLVLTSFWLIHNFAGLNPLPYHLLNVAMHAGSAILLWRVLRELNVRAAWFGAALWALHPVMVQSVAWVTELKNTQSCFFYLLSILFFLRAENELRPSAVRWRQVISLVFFVLAITSKSSVAMLPVVLLICIWWRRRRLFAKDWLVLMPFFLVSAAASAWTVWEQKFHSGAAGVEWSQPWAARLAIAGLDVWFYLGKIFWPAPLSFFYPQWKVDPAKPIYFIPLVGALCVLLLLWLKRNGPLRPVFVTVAYFVVSLFPVLGFFNVYFFRYSFVSDHFQYLAAMAPLALFASGLDSVVERGHRANSRRLFAIATPLLALCALLSWRQARNYVSAESVYRMAIKYNKEAWLAYSNLGAMYLQNRDVDQAIAYLQKALEIKPDATEAQYSLGNAFRFKQDFAEAIPAYEAALRARPNNIRARNGLAISLAATGKTNEAVEQFGEAVRLNPNDAESHYNLGYALVQLGQRTEGVHQLTEAIRVAPNYAPAIQLLRALGEGQNTPGSP
jgi:tetratricopeptide (TPR) repeat protein